MAQNTNYNALSAIQSYVKSIKRIPIRAHAIMWQISRRKIRFVCFFFFCAVVKYCHSLSVSHISNLGCIVSVLCMPSQLIREFFFSPCCIYFIRSHVFGIWTILWVNQSTPQTHTDTDNKLWKLFCCYNSVRQQYASDNKANSWRQVHWELVRSHTLTRMHPYYIASVWGARREWMNNVSTYEVCCAPCTERMKSRRTKMKAIANNVRSVHTQIIPQRVQRHPTSCRSRFSHLWILMNSCETSVHGVSCVWALVLAWRRNERVLRAHSLCCCKPYSQRQPEMLRSY